MGGGGGKGGSQEVTQEVKLPPWVEREAQRNIDVANEVAALGYVPNRTPTTPAFTPMQGQAMANLDSGAQAFGLANSGVQFNNQTGGYSDRAGAALSMDDVISQLTGLPAPTTTAGGFRGYGGGEIYDQMKAELPPAQRAFIESFAIDPITGRPPANPTVPRPDFNAAQALRGINQRTGGGGGGRGGRGGQALPSFRNNGPRSGSAASTRYGSGSGRGWVGR